MNYMNNIEKKYETSNKDFIEDSVSSNSIKDKSIITNNETNNKNIPENEKNKTKNLIINF